jgi:hypothetical protein
MRRGRDETGAVRLQPEGVPARAATVTGNGSRGVAASVRASGALIRVSGTPCWAAPVVTLGERLGSATLRGFAPNAESALDNGQMQAPRTAPISAIPVRCLGPARKEAGRRTRRCWQADGSGLTDRPFLFPVRGIRAGTRAAPPLFRHDEPYDSVRFGPGDKHGQVQALAECPQHELAYVPLATPSSAT